MGHHKRSESHGASSMAWPENRAMTQEKRPRVQSQSRGILALGPSLQTPFTLLQVLVLVLVRELLSKLVPLKQRELFFLQPHEQTAVPVSSRTS